MAWEALVKSGNGCHVLTHREMPWTDRIFLNHIFFYSYLFPWPWFRILRTLEKKWLNLANVCSSSPVTKGSRSKHVYCVGIALE